MKFTCNTKPLKTAIELGIIKSNISQFVSRSRVVKLTATESALKINIEASRIATELTLHGSGDEVGPVSVILDSITFRNLVTTFDADVTTIEFVQGGVIMHSGKSKFKLAQMSDDADSSFGVPANPKTFTQQYVSTAIDTESWKFVRDHQLFALATELKHPIYTRVWVGADGDVLVGDVDKGIFTHSKKGALADTCLLLSTIVNLFAALPDGAELIKLPSSYLIHLSTDGYDYLTEFTPEYETDEGVGEYHHEVIFYALTPSNDGVLVTTAELRKFLSQTSLLAASSDSPVSMTIADKCIIIEENKGKKEIPTETEVDAPWSCTFKSGDLRQVLSRFDASVRIAPKFDEETGSAVDGVVFSDDTMSVVLAPFSN